MKVTEKELKSLQKILEIVDKIKEISAISSNPIGYIIGKLGTQIIKGEIKSYTNHKKNDFMRHVQNREWELGTFIELKLSRTINKILLTQILIETTKKEIITLNKYFSLLLKTKEETKW